MSKARSLLRLAAAPRTIRSILSDGPIDSSTSSSASASSSSPIAISSSTVSTSATGSTSDSNGTATITDASILASLSASTPSSSSSSSARHDELKTSGEQIRRKDRTELNGWIRSVRAHKNVAFAEIDDGTGRVQSVLKGKGRAEGLNLGTSVRFTGTLRESKGKSQDVEFEVEEAEVLGACDPITYPIQKKSLPLPYLRDHAHLRFRTAQTGAVMRVRDGLMRDWHDWFEENEFVHIHTPILTSSDCEGAGEVFAIHNPVVQHHSSSSPSSTSTATSPSGPASPSSSSSPSQSQSPTPPIGAAETFFPTPVNLTVSSQLHLEAPTHSLARTYTLSPSFRAEPSLTSRHLSEFYMLEAEVAFVDTLDGLMDVVEKGIRDVCRDIMWSAPPTDPDAATNVGGGGRRRRHARMRSDLETIQLTQTAEIDSDVVGGTDFEARAERAPLSHLITTAARDFKRMTYTEAVQLCRDQHDEVGFKREAKWGEGLGTEHEKWLARYFDGPVFVIHYPEGLKPFYMLPSSATADYHHDRVRASMEGETVACFDLLFPGIGELIGGSLREHRYDELVAKMAKQGLKEEDYSWYTDLRKYGSAPHGGWGMGIDRWVCWVTGMGNVRDVVPFPRWRGNCRY